MLAGLVEDVRSATRRPSGGGKGHPAQSDARAGDRPTATMVDAQRDDPQLALELSTDRVLDDRLVACGGQPSRSPVAVQEPSKQ